MPSLFVFAEIRPRPEHFEAARNALASIIEPTCREDGCFAFQLFENQAQYTLFLFEEWRAQADLDAHYQQPYTAEVGRNYKTWLQQPPIIRKMARPI